MCPPISHFISNHIHDGVLMDANDVEADHLLRKATRDVAVEMRVLPERGGSELSLGQREPAGFSLQNYGKAKAVNRIVQMLHNKDVPPDEILHLFHHPAVRLGRK